VEPSGAVLVVDDLGSAAATSTAVLLAERGCTVEVVTSGMVVGADLGLILEAEGWHVRAAELGITQGTDLVVTGVAGSRVTLLHHPTGQPGDRTVDWVVVATWPTPADELWRELRGGELEVHRIGDCVAPRRTSAATVEGERVGAAL
jgi:hypothetical protein